VAAIEILEDGTQSAKPVHHEHHFMAVQWDNGQISDELLAVDEEVDVVVDAGASHLVTIGDRDMEA
jgi:hypothetical protein